MPKTFINNTALFIDRVKRGLPKAAEAVAYNIEAHIKLSIHNFPKPPFKTGDLARSIRVSEGPSGRSFFVHSGLTQEGKELEYAKWIEYGTSKMPARPFMRNGIASAEDTNEEFAVKYLGADVIIDF